MIQARVGLLIVAALMATPGLAQAQKPKAGEAAKPAGDKAAGFLDDVGVTFDQYLDPDSAISAELRVSGLPATLVVDADGHVVEIHSGALDEDGIRDLAATLAP